MKRIVRMMIIVAEVFLLCSCGNNISTHDANMSSLSKENNTLVKQDVPDGWNLYKNKAYSIDYSPLMEVMNPYGDVGSKMQQYEYDHNNTVVFQQTGLDAKDEDALKKYRRCFISLREGESNDYFNAGDRFSIRDIDMSDPEEYRAFCTIDEGIKETLWQLLLEFCEIPDGSHSLTLPTDLEGVRYYWKKVSNGYAIFTHYERKSQLREDRVCGDLYLLNNNDKAVILLVECFCSEYDTISSTVFEPMVNSFKWKHVTK
ncbi:MAG: hypothetical protein K5867_00075 [Bacteroidales bacterium]|nr:hypothetical protein [Bacteroidales bacterium]